MALSDADVIIPGQGFIYLAPVGTAEPSNLTSPASPWENLGHTSRDDGLGIGREGGDSETKGSWQNPALRVRRDPTTYFLTVNAHQVDNKVLSLYFGPGDVSEAGRFGVISAGTTTEQAMFVRIVDGDNELGLFVPKVDIGPEDDVEVDVEEFLAFPLRASILQVSGSNLMDFIGDNLGA